MQNATRLTKEEIKKIKSFVNPIYKFDRILQSNTMLESASVSIIDNNLRINPNIFKVLMPIEGLAEAILLHEIGHKKTGQLCFEAFPGESKETIRKKVIKLKVRCEVNAQMWAINYAMKKDMKSALDALILKSIQDAVTHDNPGELLSVYVKSAQQVIKKVKAKKHERYTPEWIEARAKNLIARAAERAAEAKAVPEYQAQHDEKLKKAKVEFKIAKINTNNVPKKYRNLISPKVTKKQNTV